MVVQGRDIQMIMVTTKMYQDQPGGQKRHVTRTAQLSKERKKATVYIQEKRKHFLPELIPLLPFTIPSKMLFPQFLRTVRCLVLTSSKTL